MVSASCTILLLIETRQGSVRASTGHLVREIIHARNLIPCVRRGCVYVSLDNIPAVVSHGEGTILDAGSESDACFQDSTHAKILLFEQLSEHLH